MSCDDRHVACEDCGTEGAHLIEADFEFQYGLAADEVTLVAKVPMWHCDACGFEWTAPGTERAQNDAISAYLGRMRPSEIREVRMAAGLSQAEFASRLHVGEASVKRWESGSNVPSKSSNKLLLDFRAGAGGNRVGVPMNTLLRRFMTASPQRRQMAARSYDTSAPFPIHATL